MSGLIVTGKTAGTPVLGGEIAALPGGRFFRPTGGFTIGTAGQQGYGTTSPDAVHLRSGSIL